MISPWPRDNAVMTNRGWYAYRRASLMPEILNRPHRIMESSAHQLYKDTFFEKILGNVPQGFFHFAAPAKDRTLGPDYPKP